MTDWRLPLRWVYTMRDIGRRPLRWLLTLTGIVLGVASVTAVFSAVEATRQGYGSLFRSVTGRATHELVPLGAREAFSPDLEALGKDPGVQAAVGVVQVPSALHTSTGPVAFLVLAVSPEEDTALREFAPPLPWTATGLRLERQFAARHGISLFDEVTLSTRKGPLKITVSGLQEAVGPMTFNGGAVGVMSLPLARAQFLPEETTFSAVHLVLAPEASVPTVPEGVVRPVGRSAGPALEMLASTEQAQVTLCAVAIVAGGLVIANTMLMHLAERRRQLALLRALGMTPGQLRALILQQALLLGLAGTLLGLPLGAALAAGLLAINASNLGVVLPGWPVVPHVLLGAGMLGPALAVAAAWPLAREAAERPPLDDLAGRPVSEPLALWPILLGVLLLAGVAVYITALLCGWLSPPWATRLQPFSAGAFLVGSACLVPPLLPLLLAPVGWLSQRAGPEARLALRLIARHPQQTGLTVGVLFAALTATIAFGTSFNNGMTDIRHWYRSTIPDDWLVRATPPDPVTVLTMGPLPVGAAEEIARIQGAATTSRIRFHSLELEGTQVVLIAREVASAQWPFALAEGDAEQAEAGYRRGEALVGAALARQRGLSVGSMITLPTVAGPRTVRVAGLIKEYSVGGLAIYLDYAPAQQWFQFSTPHVVGINALPGREAELEQALAPVAERWGVLPQPNADFEELILQIGRRIRALLMGLLALVAVVAGVGVANTLAANLLDQTRQFALLRALGMQRGQLVRLILAQAGALALAGTLAGVPDGLLLAYLMNITTPALTGQVVPFAIWPLYVLVCVAGLFAVVFLAAWWPASRAASVPMTETLRST